MYQERRLEPRPWVDYSERLFATLTRHRDLSGPWDDEPDEVLWTDETTGYLCQTRRGGMGNWCGYVCVPREHPYHGMSHEELEDEIVVHGGLTWSASFYEEGDWWFGFDCAHYMDSYPAKVAIDSITGIPDQGEVYRDLAYVKSQCAVLAAQLEALGRGALKRRGGLEMYDQEVLTPEGES